ncbi:MAG: class I SAM-dependent methyltransferase [Mycobacteriales bacterium]
MIYEDPLAYLLGVEGVALMRAFTGEYDRAFTEERIAEIRRLLADESLAGKGLEVERLTTVDGYEVWSRTYDDGIDWAAEYEEPQVKAIIDPLPAGDVLDAACGTGRWSEYLAAQGHRVIGVDSSPDMLVRARARVPAGEFRQGDLQHLPLDDGSVDLVVCALALTHVPELEPVLAEFARVLRPGGHAAISDMHDTTMARTGGAKAVLPDGRLGRMPSYRHTAGDYVRAALAAGFQIRGCEEPLVFPREVTEEPWPPTPAELTIGPWTGWPFNLTPLVPAAARAATAGSPSTVIWHLQLPAA